MWRPFFVEGSMPEIARFYGVTIFMYFDDHPPPHLHARHGRRGLCSRWPMRVAFMANCRRLECAWFVTGYWRTEPNWKMIGGVPRLTSRSR
jgi:hypothetical protein